MALRALTGRLLLASLSASHKKISEKKYIFHFSKISRFSKILLKSIFKKYMKNIHQSHIPYMKNIHQSLLCSAIHSGDATNFTDKTLLFRPQPGEIMFSLFLLGS